MTTEKSEFEEALAGEARPSADVHLVQSGAEDSGGQDSFPETAPVVETAPHSTKIDPMIGKTIAKHFLIESVIGSGGMSTVYKAKHLLLNSTVAVKVILPDRAVDDKAIMRFQQEAMASTRLHHSHIVKIFDFGVDEESRPYMVMEFVEGKSLSAIIKEQGALSANRAIDMISQACEALEHAHDKGIIHRDIKPGNIILCQDAAGQEQIKIVDFGIAKILSTDTQDLTQTGEIFGSPLYMSPEQCRGKELDARSDVYSLACTLYEMLSGSPPFCAANAIETIFQHLNKKPPRLKRTSSGNKIDERLEKIVMRGLEKSPSSRFQSMRAFRVDLARVKAGLNPSFFVSARKVILITAVLFFVYFVVMSISFVRSKLPTEWQLLDQQAVIASNHGDYKAAGSYLDQAIDKALKVHAASGDLADLLAYRGQFAASCNETEKAVDSYRKAAQFSEKAGDLPGAITRLIFATTVATSARQGDLGVASLKHAIGLQSKVSGGDSLEVAALLLRLGECDRNLNDYPSADVDLHQCLKILQSKPPGPQLQECYEQLASVQEMMGKFDPAAENFKKAADTLLVLTGKNDDRYQTLIKKVKPVTVNAIRTKHARSKNTHNGRSLNH